MFLCVICRDCKCSVSSLNCQTRCSFARWMRICILQHVKLLAKSEVDTAGVAFCLLMVRMKCLVQLNYVWSSPQLADDIVTSLPSAARLRPLPGTAGRIAFLLPAPIITMNELRLVSKQIDRQRKWPHKNVACPNCLFVGWRHHWRLVYCSCGLTHYWSTNGILHIDFTLSMSSNFGLIERLVWVCQKWIRSDTDVGVHTCADFLRGLIVCCQVFWLRLSLVGKWVSWNKRLHLMFDGRTYCANLLSSI